MIVAAYTSSVKSSQPCSLVWESGLYTCWWDDTFSDFSW